MKLVLIFLSSLIIFGCTEIKPKAHKTYSSEIHFDNKSGFYESFITDTWKMSDVACFDISLNKPYFGTKWVPLVGLVVKDEGNKYARVYLSTEEQSKGNVIALYTEGENSFTKREVILKNLELTQKTHFKLFFTEENTLNISVNGSIYSSKLIFTPLKLILNSSSSQSSIKILDDDLCK